MRPYVLFALFLIAVLQYSFSQTHSSSGPAHRTIDQGVILYLFQNRIFKSLTEKMEEMQRAYEQDSREESNVFKVYSVFARSNPLYETLLNEWIAYDPAVSSPYAARAEYYYSCAFAARGTGRAKNTSESQFAGMNRYFSLALDDIKSALKINPNVDVCYAMLIKIGMATGDDALKLNSLKQALKNNPCGYEVRSAYLFSLTPRWGGSYNQMQEFVDEAERTAYQNPDIKKLKALILADQAGMLLYQDQYDEAIRLYTEALRISENAGFYAQRGDCYYDLRQYRKALDDYDHAIALDSMDPDYLRKKASVLYEQNRLTDAQELIEQAEKLDPNNKWIRKKKEFYQSDGAKARVYASKGGELMGQGRYEEAVGQFNEALNLNGDDYISYYNRGVCFYNLQHPDEALADMHQVIARKRDYIKAYEIMSRIEFERGNYDNAIEAENFFLKLDPQNKEGYYNRALMYWKKGMKRESMDDARRSCDLGCQQACQMCEKFKKE
jgi:tetratricopeptide (TPR) repeat protein